LVKPSNWEEFLAVHSQLPIGKQIILMYLNPRDNQFVLLRWKFTCQTPVTQAGLTSVAPIHPWTRWPITQFQCYLSVNAKKPYPSVGVYQAINGLITFCPVTG
jgi:hypothetical protein